MRISLWLIIALTITYSCTIHKNVNEKNIPIKYSVERYDYFNLVKDPIENKKPLSYSYNFEIAENSKGFVVKTDCNVFDYLDNIQRKNISQNFEKTEVQFTLIVSPNGELKINDKTEIINQLKNNISKLKETPDSLNLILINTFEEYLTSNYQLDYDLLKDVKLILINDFEQFQKDKTIINYVENEIEKSIDIDNRDIDLNEIAHQGMRGVYFDQHNSFENYQKYERLAVTNPIGYSSENEPNLSKHLSALVKKELNVMNLKNGTYRYTSRTMDNNNALIEYSLELNQDTNLISKQQTIRIKRL